MFDTPANISLTSLHMFTSYICQNALFIFQFSMIISISENFVIGIIVQEKHAKSKANINDPFQTLTNMKAFYLKDMV